MTLSKIPDFWAQGINGVDYDLPPPSEWEVVRSFDSPAHSFQGIFPIEQSYPELYTIRAESEGTPNWDDLLFSGKLDEQVISEDESGKKMRVMARSSGGILLDNEVKPQTFNALRLKTLFELEVQQLGFTLFTNENPVMQTCVMRKGTSAWEALSNFYRNATSGFTWLSKAGMLHCNRVAPSGTPRVVSNRQAGAIQYESISVVNNRYLPVSDYLIRQPNGAYSSSYVNPRKTALKLKRKRYLDPSPEFSDYNGLGYYEAQIRCNRSMLGKEVVTVVCPGILNIDLCDRVDVDGDVVSYSARFLHQIRWKLDARGTTTTLTLLNANYL